MGAAGFLADMVCVTDFLIEKTNFLDSKHVLAEFQK